MRALPFLCLLVFCQGCFVYHYTTTPPLSGTVKDVTTKQAVSGAAVGFREHGSITTETAMDGTFRLKSDRAWHFCWIMPGEFWAEGGVFFIEAPGYQPFEQEIHTRHGTPFLFQGAVELHPNSK